MKNDSKALRNIVLISQLSICLIFPTFLSLALCIWLYNKFGTLFTIPLLFIGMAAGSRNAYVLAMNSVRQEEARKKKEQQMIIDQKVEEYRKRQENDSSDDKE